MERIILDDIRELPDKVTQRIQSMTTAEFRRPSQEDRDEWAEVVRDEFQNLKSPKRQERLKELSMSLATYGGSKEGLESYREGVLAFGGLGIEYEHIALVEAYGTREDKISMFTQIRSIPKTPTAHLMARRIYTGMREAYDEASEEDKEYYLESFRKATLLDAMFFEYGNIRNTYKLAVDRIARLVEASSWLNIIGENLAVVSGKMNSHEELQRLIDSVNRQIMDLGRNDYFKIDEREGSIYCNTQRVLIQARKLAKAAKPLAQEVANYQTAVIQWAEENGANMLIPYFLREDLTNISALHPDVPGEYLDSYPQILRMEGYRPTNDEIQRAFIPTVENAKPLMAAVDERIAGIRKDHLYAQKTINRIPF